MKFSQTVSGGRGSAGRVLQLVVAGAYLWLCPPPFPDTETRLSKGVMPVALRCLRIYQRQGNDQLRAVNFRCCDFVLEICPRVWLKAVLLFGSRRPMV